MAFSVRLMLRASEDAERIYGRVSKEAPLKGQEWYNRLVETLYSLERFPERGRVIESLSTPANTIRQLLYGRRPHSYRIYFDVVAATVRILHIRHGARKDPRRSELFK